MGINKRSRNWTGIFNRRTYNTNRDIEKLAIERLDRIDDKITQTHTMFILGLTLFFIAFGYLWNSNTINKINNTILINDVMLICIIVDFLVILIVWNNKISEYLEIKKNILSIINAKNRFDKISDILSVDEKKETFNIGETADNILIISSFTFLIGFLLIISIFLLSPIIIVIFIFFNTGVLFIEILYSSGLSKDEVNKYRTYLIVSLIISFGSYACFYCLSKNEIATIILYIYIFFYMISILLIYEKIRIKQLLNKINKIIHRHFQT